MFDNIYNFIRNHLKDPVIIEAGACDGTDTLKISDAFPSATIHSFEPVPSLYQTALQKLKDRPNVKLHNLALSDRTGTQAMNLAKEWGEYDCGSSSLLKPKLHLEYYKRIKFEETIQVKTIRLDEFVERENIKHIDFIWLDIQGYEPLLLKDSPKTLEMTRFVYTETQNTESYEGGVLTPQYIDFMVSKGFTLVMNTAQLFLDSGDLLFVKNEH